MTETTPAPTADTTTPLEQSRTNLWAIISLAGVFLAPILGVIAGHIALSQTRRTRESGRGFAIAGVIIGYISIAATIAFLAFYFLAIFAAMFASFSTMGESNPYYY
jgi:CHASE2 domain-containing sensor protein